VLTTLLVGVGWGAPAAHAACAPDRCGTTGAAAHCEYDRASTSAVCLTHHASQDALISTSPVPDGQGGGTVGTDVGPEAPATGTAISSLPFGRRTAERARRLHLRVGVWLEWRGRC